MKRYLCLYYLLMCLISACGSTPTKVALQPSATLPALPKTPTITVTLPAAATASSINAASTSGPSIPTSVAPNVTPIPHFPTPIFSTTLITEMVGSQFDLRQALKMMYGPTAIIYEETYGFSVKIPGKDQAEWAWENLVMSYQENGVNKYLVVTSRGGGCHACPMFIDAAAFSQHDDRWQIEVNQKRITFAHSVDKGRWGAIGPHRHGVLLLGQYAGQGYSGETTLIITEVDGIFKEVFRLPTTESYRDVIDESHVYWAHTSQLEFQDSGSEWYNIVVKHEGTGRDQKPLPEKSVYVFSNGKYELVIQP